MPSRLGWCTVLHDREELFTVVEQLINLEMRENRHPRNSHKGVRPVVLALGRRGSGKTAALNEIYEAYSHRVPQAFVDLAAERYVEVGAGPRNLSLPLLRGRGGRPSSRRPGWDTSLLRLLRALKWDLELDIPDNGRLSFPRLDIAQLAIASWQRDWRRDTRISPTQAQQQLNRAREAVSGVEKAEHDDTAVAWISDVLSGLSGAAASFPVDVFIEATVSAFLERTLPQVGSTVSTFIQRVTRHGPEVPVQWHGHLGSGESTDPYDALITLARDWSDPNRRKRHEARLVSAFLADLSAGYTGLAGMSRAALPLVLLDNVDASPAGARFLALTLADRGRAGRKPDPLLLIATAPETFAVPGPVTAAGPRSIALAPLADDAAVRELGQADPWDLPADFSLLVHRFAGGLPLGVRLLTRAAVGTVTASPDPAATAPGTGTPWPGMSGLLDLPAPADPAEEPAGARAATAKAAHGGGTRSASLQPVTELLLKRLIPDETWRTRLTLLSCARDDAEARALLAKLMSADQVQFVVSDAEELLLDNDWLAPDQLAGQSRCQCAPPVSGFFVGDAFLRALLRHQLEVTGKPMPAATAHATLRDLYGAPGSGALTSEEQSRLYHCLALGEARQVVDRLHTAFADSDPVTWLATLAHAAAAPSPRPAAPVPGSEEDPRQAIAAGGGKPVGTDPVHLSINRLLHAAWYLHDPLVSPEGEAEAAIERLADELRTLAREHGHGVLFPASRDWPRMLREWNQSYCPTAEGE